MLIELFETNLASTVVISGGMSAPEAGTIETLTVSEANGIFPVVRRGIAQFHFKDRDPEYGEEIFCCIETNGNHWLVIRGAGNTRPIPHGRKFMIRQVITAEFFQRLGGGSTTDLVNPVTVYGADNTGNEAASEAISAALESGPTYLPRGVYRLDKPLNLVPGNVLISFADAILRPGASFRGDAAIELVDGLGAIRLEGLILDGSELNVGHETYGIFAETQQLEAEVRSIRIRSFPLSGAILSGFGWQLDRVTCRENFHSGFELNISDSLLIGCRAVRNAKYGFTGHCERLIGCYARDNQLGDFNPPLGKSVEKLQFVSVPVQ